MYIAAYYSNYSQINPIFLSLEGNELLPVHFVEIPSHISPHVFSKFNWELSVSKSSGLYVKMQESYVQAGHNFPPYSGHFSSYKVA